MCGKSFVIENVADLLDVNKQCTFANQKYAELLQINPLHLETFHSKNDYSQHLEILR
jgi:hypothetical protein